MACLQYDVLRVMKTRFPQIVMVLSCASSEGDVMPTHIFEQGLSLKSDSIVELLNTKVTSWLEADAGRAYV